MRMRGVLRVRKSTPLMSPGIIVSGVILALVYKHLNGWILFGLIVLAFLINAIVGARDVKEVHIDPE